MQRPQSRIFFVLMVILCVLVRCRNPDSSKAREIVQGQIEIGTLSKGLLLVAELDTSCISKPILWD